MVFTASVCLALGVGLFALWDAWDNRLGNQAPSPAGDVHPPMDSVDHASRASALTPHAPHAPRAPAEPTDPTAGVVPTAPDLSDADETPWNEQVIDTGPFIDADDDRGDYGSGPVSDVGEFLDPDA